MPAKKKPPTNRSGTTWTEADYEARGYHTIKARLKSDGFEALAREAERRQITRAQTISALAIEADERAKKIRAKNG